MEIYQSVAFVIGLLLLLLLLLLSRFTRVQLCATPWTAAHQAPPSLGFARQEYWSGVPLPSHSDNPRFPNKKMSTPPAHNYAAYKNTGVRKLI